MTADRHETTYPERPTGETIRLGLARRCPRCGAGRMFSGYLTVADTCEVCGLDFGGHDSGDAPVVPSLLVLGGIVVAAALITEVRVGWPVWKHLAVWLPLALLGTLLMLPRVKGVGIALQHKYRSTESEEERKLGGQ